MRSLILFGLVVLPGMMSGPTGAPTQRHLSPAVVARRVARVYGEKRPHIVHQEQTETDSTPHQPMYFLGMSGSFRKGSKHARYLYFSALANRWHVWGIAAYDVDRHLVWTDAALPLKN